MVDRNGLPLALVLTGANVHDGKALTDRPDATIKMVSRPGVMITSKSRP